MKILGLSTTNSNQRHSKPAENHDKDQEGVADMICNFSQQQGDPDVEVDKLIRNLLKYKYFFKMFEAIVERKIKDPVGRLTRLIKFTDGEPKDLVKRCIHLIPDIGYNNAITLLNKRYGNHHSLSTSYRMEIKSLVLIKLGDAMSSRRINNFDLK